MQGKRGLDVYQVFHQQIGIKTKKYHVIIHAHILYNYTDTHTQICRNSYCMQMLRPHDGRDSPALKHAHYTLMHSL